MHHDETEPSGPSTSAARSGWATYPADFWHGSRRELITSRFWMYCATKYGGPILDLCCGNGRYAIALAEAGYEVVGVDINEGLIELARQWASQRAADGRPRHIRFEVGDIVALHLDSRFRLAVMPGWSFQVLLTQEDQIAFFRHLREHLEPGGAFAFNTFVPFHRQRGLRYADGQWSWPPDPKYRSGAARTYDPVSQIESLLESNVHPIRLRHTNLAEIQLLCRLTGFAVREIFGDDQTMCPFSGAQNDDYTVIAERLDSPAPAGA